MKLPEIKLASLETLYMRCVLTNDPIGEGVSQSFPSFRRLSLIHINMEEDFMKTKQHDLTIRSSRLEDLAIHDCCIYEIVRVITQNLRGFSCVCTELYFCAHAFWDQEYLVEITAPNLQSLTLEGLPERLCCEGTFKNLNLVVVTGRCHST